MDKDKHKTVRLRPHRAERIQIVKENLHPSYSLEADNSAEAGDTGLLALFHLKSNDTGLPSFRGRWDIQEDAVDIDLFGIGDSKLFKSQKNGYRGHHSTNLGDRRYQIDIAIPGYEIFRGVLELDASGILYLKDEAKLQMADSFKIFDVSTGKEIATR